MYTILFNFLLAQSQTLVSGCVHDILISCEVGFACVCVCADDVTSIVFDWLKRLMIVSSEFNFIIFKCFKIFSPQHRFEQDFVNS